MRPLNLPMRVVFAATGLAALIPAGAVPEFGVLLDIVGVVGGAAALFYEYLAVTRLRALAAPKAGETNA
jgi:hypothetical protein